MKDDTLDRLRALGADTLATALLELADRDRAAQAYVERLVATPSEVVKRFKARLAGLRRSKAFVPRSGASEIAAALRDDLAGLRASNVDPRTGVELVDAFFRTADATFLRCDDSYGLIGSVFRHDAAELFIGCAARCDDRPWLLDLVERAALDSDEFNIIDVIVERASEYLSEPEARALVSRLRAVDPALDPHRRVARLTETIASAIGDPTLYLEVHAASGRQLAASDRIRLARMYLERGDAAAARTEIEQVPEGAHVHGETRVDELRMSIYERLGDSGSLEATAWRSFRQCRTPGSLERLLSAIGPDRRQSVLESEIREITASDDLSTVDVLFLMEIGEVQAAAEYLLARSAKVNGEHYESYVQLAKALEIPAPLAATMLYRALVDAILRRSRVKAYNHAATYLRKLEQLASQIDHWREFPGHAEYVAALHAAHARKSSFWSKVDRR